MAEDEPQQTPESGEPKPVSVLTRIRIRVAAALFTLAIAALAFFIGLGIFNYVVMPRLVHQGEETRVPDLADLSVPQAERVLDDAGLRLSVRGEQYHPEVPKGFILWQDPDPNDVVRRGRSVSVLLSLGAEFASVPDLTGETQRSARLLLVRAGLEVGQVVETWSPGGTRGFVLASDPAGQSVVPRGSPVHLIVSRGSASDAQVMPDLRGRDVKDVKRDLEAIGYRVVVAGDVGQLSSIVQQSPPPGSRIDSGDEITLRVAGRVIP